MDEYWVQLAITVLLTTIKQTVKNPAKKQDLKRAFLKVRDAINALYAGDPDFE